ncbi:hypothetical protein J2801_001691 [Paraburkholderia phenoliruptrix]|uniref:hypothetical protein n=1 Tax=Paraburkholderia phenoliruptrix TaxID=252970 RepID=UPI00285A4D89|nr:hypothetical protein [Paraburkholderia phenoliruptrix]MDR6419440.1 hypothetical protein [Paraburkholderia phenoliruptrix]
MNRVARSIAYMCVGMVLSWQSALWISRLARRLSWPLFMTHWRGCWDIERCDVSAFGYAFIAAFIFAPTIIWAIAGFRTANSTARRIGTALLLASGTVSFYLIFYAAIWP